MKTLFGKLLLSCMLVMVFAITIGKAGAQDYNKGCKINPPQSNPAIDVQIYPTGESRDLVIAAEGETVYVMVLDFMDCLASIKVKNVSDNQEIAITGPLPTMYEDMIEYTFTMPGCDVTVYTEFETEN
jgi:hypothetical protein